MVGSIAAEAGGNIAEVVAVGTVGTEVDTVAVAGSISVVAGSIVAVVVT